MKRPVPTADWSVDMLKLYDHDCLEVWEPGRSRGVYLSYQFRLRWYQEFLPGRPARIFEAGCAQATLGLMLAEQGHTVLAVDIREDFVRYASLRFSHGDVKLRTANLATDNLEGPHDLIYLNQVVEHVTNPQAMLTNLRKVLDQDGQILITTPNYDYFRNVLPTFAEFMESSNGSAASNTADGEDHVFAYTVRELANICQESGLRIIRTGFYETPVLSGHAQFRTVNQFIPGSLLGFLEKMLSRIPGLNKFFCYQIYILAAKG